MSDVPGFVAVELDVRSVTAVEGFANLLEHMEGKSLVVLMSEELVRSSKMNPGDVIACRVRRAGLDRTFVHRNHMSIQHPR